ncbi:uncharacterized protein LOC103708308 isoform X5 [Phoenix dactylifera]|uniref:Uncharacterized protein LOC103708308 isoform X5 n=1 Tax=Phoenix dactylifera TaxID=42345 RepID=A0A8B8J5M2_PHODC|nr:uncharacterized protein LOC103708308 isoform X5 [Phoenix dactylifera]
MADGSLGPAALRSPRLHFSFPHPFPFVTSSSSVSLSVLPMAAGPCNGACSPRAISSFSSNPDNIAPPSLLVFSGGTAFNGVIEELKKVTTRVAHVLPVSDDGGSTAEIVRVLGGPAVGDIRSRCLRLSDESTSEALAVRRLLGHRLSLDASEAKTEWYEIVEGEHYLWNGVSRPYRETIRAFLVYFQNQILRRSNESFCFSNGSIGNFFFAGARIFFQSLDAAIFLFSRVSEIPTESLVLPVISTNDRLTLGCELWDGTIIRGQNEISHPTNGCMEPINKDCTSTTALPSRIKRVFYMSSEGSNLLHEVLHGIGEAIASRSIPKVLAVGVLLLNGSHDRETTGLSASGFVSAITDALNRTYGDPDKSLKKLPSDYINALLVPRDGQVAVDVHCLADQGIFHVAIVDSVHIPKVGTIFDPKCLIKALTDLIGAYKDDSMLHSKAM